MVSRRDFLKMGAAGMAALYVTKRARSMLHAFAYAQSDNLRKFIQPLRMVGTDIPVAQPDTVNPGWWQPGVTHYTIDAAQFEDQLHPDLPNPTRLWGYGQVRATTGISAGSSPPNATNPSRSPFAITCRPTTSCRLTGRSWERIWGMTAWTCTCTAGLSRGSATAVRTPGGGQTANRVPASSTTRY